MDILTAVLHVVHRHILYTSLLAILAAIQVSIHDVHYVVKSLLHYFLICYYLDSILCYSVSNIDQSLHNVCLHWLVWDYCIDELTEEIPGHTLHYIFLVSRLTSHHSLYVYTSTMYMTRHIMYTYIVP